MNSLKLNQRILADSTCYFSSGQIVELCPTTLNDARNTPNGIRIDLGGGHDWGCIPSRERKSVIAEIGDLREFFDKKISSKEGIEQRLKNGKSIIRVYQNGNNTVLYVVEFKKHEEVDSLKDGKYVVFRDDRSISSSVKVINGNLPQGFYTNIEDAFNVLERFVKEIL